jgi:N-acetylglucosaminyldiphosphoundecaprenol N-acetyl-beta-D-mannosaminyltransferase
MAATTAIDPSASNEARPARDRDIRLFGMPITDTTIPRAALWLAEQARQSRPTNVAFLNAHCVNVAYTSNAYREAMTSMDRVFADGIGVRIAARWAGIDLQDNVNGTDLFPVLCEAAAGADIGIFLLGARHGIASAAAEHMQARTPSLRISGTHHGYIADPAAEDRAIAEINASGAGILLVAMGVPSQELWIARNSDRLNVPVVVGVGGLFDYYSGRIPRAPAPLRKAGLEWAWRLAQEPGRLARRYLVGNIEFLARLAWLRLTAPSALT